MPVRLILVRENEKLALDLNDGTYTIGGAAPAQIVLSDLALAPIHAELTVSGDTATVMDPGGNRGTFVNDLRLMQYDVRVIKPGDRIMMGEAILVLEGVEGGSPASGAPELPVGVPSAPAGSGEFDLIGLFFSPSGRSGRMAFWLGNLLVGIPYIALYVMGRLAQGRGEVGLGCGMVILMLALVWPLLVIQIRRFHDRDKSGWWILIYFIPIIGQFWALIELGFLPGTPGPNDYGNA